MTAYAPVSIALAGFMADEIARFSGEDEPRIQDRALAVRLGFARPRKIRDIIERNRAELEAYGTLHEISATEPEADDDEGAPQQAPTRPGLGRVYWLNEDQALVLCALSSTTKAAEIRRALILAFKTFRAERLDRAAARPDDRARPSRTGPRRKTPAGRSRHGARRLRRGSARDRSQRRARLRAGVPAVTAMPTRSPAPPAYGLAHVPGPSGATRESLAEWEARCCREYGIGLDRPAVRVSRPALEQAVADLTALGERQGAELARRQRAALAARQIAQDLAALDRTASAAALRVGCFGLVATLAAGLVVLGRWL